MSEFVHDLEWHKEHKRLGFYDPIAELYESLEKAQLSEEDATFNESQHSQRVESVGDYISRQAAIDALADMYRAAEKWGQEADDDVIKARAESCMASLVEMKLRIEKLPSAQPDLSEHSTWFRIGETLVDESKKHITAEQAVDKIRGYMIRMKKPERKKGEWIKDGCSWGTDWWKCSACKESQRDVPTVMGTPKWNFCHNCGADMSRKENR